MRVVVAVGEIGVIGQGGAGQVPGAVIGEAGGQVSGAGRNDARSQPVAGVVGKRGVERRSDRSTFFGRPPPVAVVMVVTWRKRVGVIACRQRPARIAVGRDGGQVGAGGLRGQKLAGAVVGIGPLRACSMAWPMVGPSCRSADCRSK